MKKDPWWKFWKNEEVEEVSTLNVDTLQPSSINYDSLIEEAKDVVTNEKLSLIKKLNLIHSSIDENQNKKDGIQQSLNILIREKEFIQQQLPALKASGSIKGLQKKELLLIEIDDNVQQYTKSIEDLTASIDTLICLKNTTEKQTTEKIEDIESQISDLILKKQLIEAEKLASSTLNGVNVSNNRLDHIDKKLHEASLEIAVQRRINSLNIPVDQR